MIAAALDLLEDGRALAKAVRDYLGGEADRADVDLALGDMEWAIAKAEGK